jgi:hypothetical protein
MHTKGVATIHVFISVQLQTVVGFTVIDARVKVTPAVWQCCAPASSVLLCATINPFSELPETSVLVQDPWQHCVEPIRQSKVLCTLRYVQGCVPSATGYAVLAAARSAAAARPGLRTTGQQALKV